MRLSAKRMATKGLFTKIYCYHPRASIAMDWHGTEERFLIILNTHFIKTWNNIRQPYSLHKLRQAILSDVKSVSHYLCD